MGLFSWLFKKKKDASKEEERHFIDDVQKERKPRKTMIKNEAEKSNIEYKKAEPTSTEVLKNEPEEDATATKIGEDKSAESVKVKGFGGAFDIKKSRDGRYVFNLYAANRVIVATSQIYSSSQSAITGIKSVIANAERANIEDQTLKQYQPMPYPKWEIYEDKGGQYRWRLLATNGSCILHSQGYTQKSTCKKGIESVIRTAKNAKIDKSYLDK
jgi:uncharacterized protein YegP (UPF0339 family)